MPLDYRVYGLTLRANRRLPHLLPASPADDNGIVEVLFDVEAGDRVRFRVVLRRGGEPEEVAPLTGWFEV